MNLENLILENEKLKKEIKFLKRKKLLISTSNSIFFDNFDLKFILYKADLNDEIGLEIGDMISSKRPNIKCKINIGEYLNLLDFNWNTESYIEHKNIYEVEWIIHGYYKIDENKIQIITDLHHDIIKMMEITNKNINDFGFNNLDDLIEYYQLNNYQKQFTNIYLIKMNKVEL